MKNACAIVSTARFILLVDLVTKAVTVIEEGRGDYYGISWFPGERNLTLSHAGLDYADLVDLPSYALSEVGFLSCGQKTTAALLSAPHQILCAPDDRVVCTNTGRNAVTVLDFARTSCFQETRISKSRWDRLSPSEPLGDHLNSLFFKDGSLWVVAHGFVKGSRIAVLSYPDLEVVSVEPVNNLTGLHNLWVTSEGQRISCHSDAGSLVDLTSGEVLWESGAQVYTRGLAASADFVVIGESQKMERNMRRGSLSGLWLIDRKTWLPLDYFYLGPYGAVHDVRLLNVPDEAHHGVPFAGCEDLMNRPLDVEFTGERLKASAKARSNRQAWAGFEVVLGNPIREEDGGNSAVEDSLCLLVRRNSGEASPFSVGFRYCLDGAPGKSHVSAAIYRGSGGDTDMHAFLMQRTGESKAALRLWVHDGEAWAIKPGVEVNDLTIRGELCLNVSSDTVQVHLDGRVILDVSRHQFSIPLGRGAIRVSGATVYPLAK